MANTINHQQLTVVLFNKPFRVLCQFSPSDSKATLADFIKQPGIYPAGRLDYDSEGLLLLTGDGRLQHQLTDPKHKLPKTYWVQIEGQITERALKQLREGIRLKDGVTRPARASQIAEPTKLWSRDPPIRFRANIPTSWIELTIHEGKNRQVRRMTAAVGFPTLRLIRSKIGPWSAMDLAPGEKREVTVPNELFNKNTSRSRRRPPHQRSKAR